ELHLGSDLAAPRVVHLRHAPARLGAKSPAPAGAGLDVAAREDPVTAQRRQPLLEVHDVVGIRVGAARVVEAEALAVAQDEVAHGDPNGWVGAGAGQIGLHSRPPFAGITQVRSLAVGSAVAALSARFRELPRE